MFGLGEDGRGTLHRRAVTVYAPRKRFFCVPGGPDSGFRAGRCVGSGPLEHDGDSGGASVVTIRGGNGEKRCP